MRREILPYQTTYLHRHKSARRLRLVYANFVAQTVASICALDLRISKPVGESKKFERFAPGSRAITALNLWFDRKLADTGN